MDKAAFPAVDLVELLSSLDDPRAVDGRRHRLGDILVIAFCTVLCGQQEFTAMERFGLQKEAWLRGFLELPGGIPSHDTFRAVLSALDARQLAQALIDWTEGVREKLGRAEIVAIDGKSARRTADVSGAKAALHLVNAWAVDNGLCLGQEQTGEKSNEITAVPLLLRQLELAGCIVTADALNTQKDIAREIKEADADYVLTLKANHPLLHQEVSDFLLDAKARGFAGTAHDFFEEADKGHGRLEIRRHFDHARDRLDHPAWRVGGAALRRTRRAPCGTRRRA
jgi:predicted transposase YbfD/YdcC